jgi:hypothetical protein
VVGHVGTHGTNPAMRKLAYDAVNDFTAIAMVGGTPNVLVVHPSVPAATLQELVAHARGNPGKLNYGSAGPGTLTHLAMEQYKLAANFFAVHIPYRGIGPAFTDLLGGQTQAMLPALAAALPHVRAHKMRPLAVTGLKRHPLPPDVPTFEELGFISFDGVQWYGIVGPARLPEPITQRLNEEINRALASSELRARLDIAGAALVNGITSHTFDFDDTHRKTIIHPAGPVACAALALAEHTQASGRAPLDALVLGIDVACRVGNAIYPEHYDRGWHITGSTGMLGAAAAGARLLGLDEGRTAMALGIAAPQPVGLREQFGTMTKPFHPGAAARAGLTLALLAKHGFTASGKALEAPRGLMQVVSAKCRWNEISDELGPRFEISFNSYKPFACGIVIHPSIDACTRLRARGVQPDEVERIELKVHPLVLQLTGKKEPANGLQGKFSVYHGCAAGLIFGRAGEEEFSDAIVRRPDLVALRRKAWPRWTTASARNRPTSPRI